MQTLRGRITFFGLMICLFAGSVVSFYTLKKNKDFFQKTYYQDTQFKLESITQTITNNSEKIKSDALFLASTPPIMGILRASKNKGIDPKDGSSIETWKKRLQTIFEEMLFINSDYTQLRYIGSENEGKEIVRVERFGNKVLSVKEINLQKKGNTDYFKNTLKEYPYKVYFSKISANKEFGKVIYPVQMVLRAGVPIFESNQSAFGGVFINADYTTLFKGLDFLNKNTHILLIKDESGRALVSYSDGFKFYTDENNLEINHSDLFKIKEDKPQVFSTKLYYNDLNPEQYLTISLSSATNQVEKELLASYLSEGIVVLFLLLVSTMVSFLFAKRFVKPLESLQYLTQRISRGDYNEEHLIYSKDSSEVGFLNNALIDMAKDVRDSKKQVEDQKKALDSSAIVVETDDRGKITYVNEKFIEISGYSRGELLGQDHRIINSGFHDKDFFKELWGTIKNGLVWKGEIKNRSKDGEFYWVDTTIYPVRGNDNKIFKFIAIRLDITEPKRIQEDYLKALETRTNFLANMSHEIRTPLNGIMGFTEILMQKKLDLDSKAEVEHIRNCSEGLLQIINDILDISKMESGKLEFTHDVLSIKDCIEKSISVVETNLKEKDLKFDYKVSSQIDEKLIGDEMRIRQVLLNLLSNAIKFSPDRGTISLNLSLENDDHSFQTLYFIVEDKGIGISPEQQEKLFESFNQADSSISKKYGGTGLGLAITKKIVNRLGGDIWIESEINKGTKIHFTIKLPKAGSELISIKKPSSNRFNSDLILNPKLSMDVLVAEDNKTNQILLEKMLKKIGDFNITFAENGRDALNELEKRSFPLIFMDVQMPLMDGLTATIKARKELDYQGIIIGLSANAFEEDFEKGKEAGMDYYLSKPVNSKKLKEIFHILREEKDFVQFILPEAS